MSKLKIKQIDSTGAPAGAVLVTDGDGRNSWVVPSTDGSTLGTPDDGALTDARYPGGKPPAVDLTPTTKVVNAIDSINEVLGLLLPNAPTAFAGAPLSLSTANTSARLASGYSTNAVTGAPVGGTLATRVTALTVNTAVIEDRGNGMEGTLSAFHNGAELAGEALTFTGDLGQTKNTGVLRVSDNKWGGTAVGGGAAPEGFFQTFDAQLLNASALVGLNTLQIKHSLSGDSSVLVFVRDSLTATPVVSNVTAVEANPVLTKWSGIDHYSANSTFTVGAELTNLAGETYSDGTIISITGPGAARNFTAGQAGLPAILEKDTLNFSMVGQTFTVNPTPATRSRNVRLTVTGTNPNGSGSAQSGVDMIVVNQGGPTAFNDHVIPGPATTSRVYLSNGTGDTPSDLSALAWASSQDLSAAGFRHEAAWVGGTLRRDLTNYSVGYMPAGQPDYSVKDATQYATYRLSIPARSSLNVTVTGDYSGLYVALPGISNDPAQSPNALGGAWWDAMTPYNGAGLPGRAGQNAGCGGTTVANGSSGTFNITFGSGNSSNSTGNYIYIRVKLTGNQSITALSLA